MTPHNKQLMFYRERSTPRRHSLDCLSQLPKQQTISHPLTCSLSQSPLLESQDLLFFCRAGADVSGFPSALHPHQQVGRWARAHKHQQLWWDHPYTSYGHHQRGPAILFLVLGLIWTHHVTLKLQPRRHLKHSHHISKHTVSERV